MNTAIDINPRGPIIGYSSEEKESYRNHVWDVFKSSGSIEEILKYENVYALLLPAKHGEEIETAIKYGVPEEKIIAVDENPALIAVSSWRKKRPLVKYYGCMLSDVGKKLIKDNRLISCANLDFCNNFSLELIEEIDTFLRFAPKTDPFTFSITMMKGRESKALLSLINKIDKFNSIEVVSSRRMKALVLLSDMISEFMSYRWSNDFSFLKFLGEGSYINHKTPMEYMLLSYKSDLGILKKVKLNLEKYSRTKKRYEKVTDIRNKINQSIPFPDENPDKCKKARKMYQEWNRNVRIINEKEERIVRKLKKQINKIECDGCSIVGDYLEDKNLLIENRGGCVQSYFFRAAEKMKISLTGIK